MKKDRCNLDKIDACIIDIVDILFKNECDDHEKLLILLSLISAIFENAGLGFDNIEKYIFHLLREIENSKRGEDENS